MSKGDEVNFDKVLQQVLDTGKVNRENFFDIIEALKGKQLSTQDFFRLYEIIQSNRSTYLEHFTPVGIREDF